MFYNLHFKKQANSNERFDRPISSLFVERLGRYDQNSLSVISIIEGGLFTINDGLHQEPREKDWLEKKRADDCLEPVIRELIRIEPIGYGGNGQFRVCVELLAYADGGLPPSGVAVHHDDEMRYREQKLMLSSG